MSEIQATPDEIFERIDDAFFALDDEWRFTYLNDRAAELIDVDRGKVIGGYIWDEFPEAVDTAFQTKCEQAAKSGEQVTFGEYYPPLDRWFEVNAHPGPGGLSVYFRDVTERRERERELGRTRRLLEHTERITDVGGWEIDPETEEVFWTEHLFELLEADVDEEPSMEGALDGYLEEDRRRVERAIESALQDGERFDVDARFETPSGEVRWLRVQGEPEIEDGEVVTLRGGAQDITDRKEREEQLHLYRRIAETVDDGVYALDHANDFVLVNDAFCELTGYDREELLGRDCTLVKDESTVAEIERVVERQGPEGDESVSVEFELETKGGERIPVEDRIQRISFADGIGRCGVVRDVTERRERERELHRRVEQQAVVTRLGKRALGDPPLDALMSETARIVSEVLEVDYCKVLDLDEEGEELLLRQGVGWRDGIVGSKTVSAVADDSQAAYTLSTSEPVVVADLETETRFSGPDLLTSHGVTSGISTVIGPDDDPWGILGVHDRDERTFSEQDVNFVQSVANVLGTAIRRYQDEQELRARHERLAALNDINSLVHRLSESLFELSSKTAIEELVCERLADSGSYEFAWIGSEGDGEIVANTESGVEGYLSDLDLSLDETPGSQGPTVQAHVTGEIQVVQNVQEDPRYEQWRDRGSEYGYRASAAVPVVDGGQQYGILNVYSSRDDAFSEEEREALRRLGSIVAYAVRAIERDRNLQRERDRIEFMNRLLRHNLLNSLNVVEARLDLLDGRVDYEVSGHLETASERTSEMIDFVETVREVTKVIGHGDEQELRPVDLGDVLASRVARAKSSYPAAEFHLEQVPSVEILADDLPAEVLDNVLSNAVQHNDSDSPVVWIETSIIDDAVVVSIADDGPGISPEQRSDIFDREARNFEDPSSGFGLYLVKEIIDSYGGDVDVTKSEAGGARFDLTFPRP